MPRAPQAMKTGNEMKNLKRILKDLWKEFGFKLFIIIFFIIITSFSNTLLSVFLKDITNKIVNPVYAGQTFADVRGELVKIIITMAIIYVIGITCSIIQTQLVAIYNQRFLGKMRERAFKSMEKLPIKYFDQHPYGDVMSIYVNDVDAIRELVGGSLPQLVQNVSLLCVLVYLLLTRSIWIMLLIFLGVFGMFMVTKFIGGKSAKFFVEQRKTYGKFEGYIEEMMAGQKVVKVFNHEEQAKIDFAKVNEQLRVETTNANMYGNILGPFIGNIGNMLYVLVLIVGAILYAIEAPNLTITGITVLTIGDIVSFLNISRQFTNNINQSTAQVNNIVMGLAGAGRVYQLIDEKPEFDDGYVTLVNAKYDENGNITECKERTGLWAWKHPHQADGSITYTKLSGDIRMFDVDFGYVPEKIVLHDVTLYAEPGQKVAFVGATGAGKTTITNLINRFYDIADGKIRYDGININKIKKSDLRKSLGIVLQDTNLFTGTVMENIRYGKLDATDEEVYKAAKIANAYDFITRLPDGFNTMLESDGANLSQGQRQLLSIARAAVADTPVMILDEATSSIDTRTELLVQKGTDQLMEGRTVFVIAHRLSTVQNSDVIMVLDHGVIIERGSHEDLINKKGQYYQLYTGAFELE